MDFHIFIKCVWSLKWPHRFGNSLLTTYVLQHISVLELEKGQCSREAILKIPGSHFTQSGYYFPKLQNDSHLMTHVSHMGAIDFPIHWL